MIDAVARIVMVCPTTPSSKSVIAVVPAVLNTLPIATVGVASVEVNVTILSAVPPVSVAVPPMKFHEPSIK